MNHRWYTCEISHGVGHKPMYNLFMKQILLGMCENVFSISRQDQHENLENFWELRQEQEFSLDKFLYCN